MIIRSIYEALENMGFEKGNVLEPSMGIGNFFGMLPEKMQESRLYGVELDGITGRIAKQLYPKADIKITGFEKRIIQTISLILQSATCLSVSIRWQTGSMTKITF